MSDINVTPLVDVMLVLVVIFIITAPLMASSIRLDLPAAEAAYRALPPGRHPGGGQNAGTGIHGYRAPVARNAWRRSACAGLP
jgi:hypothetical protein